MDDRGDIGQLIRAWRNLRGCSQRELAHRTGLSVRHLSFIETGRAAPSRDAVLWITQALDIPGSETGLLLEAAGFLAPYPASVHGEARIDHRAELQRLLDVLDPRPAMLHDVYGTLHAYNHAFAALMSRLVDLDDYTGEHDGLRLVAELRQRIGNWEQLMELFIRRLHDELFRAEGRTKTQLQVQLDRLAAAVPQELIATALDRRSELGLLVPLEILLPDGPLHLEAATLTTGTPIHIGVRQLRVMLFVPRNAETAARIDQLLAEYSPMQRGQGALEKSTTPGAASQ